MEDNGFSCFFIFNKRNFHASVYNIKRFPRSFMEVGAPGGSGFGFQYVDLRKSLMHKLYKAPSPVRKLKVRLSDVV